MLYRVSGVSNVSKGTKYPYFIPTVFNDHESASDAAEMYVENVIMKHEDSYKASIEGRKGGFNNAYDAIDTFSAIVNENLIISLNVFPVKKWNCGANYLYTYRGYDIAEHDDTTWNISASGFVFGYVSKDNLEAALQHIDHLVFESNLQMCKEDDE